MENWDSFIIDLQKLINIHSLESLCGDIPDFILAESVVGFLKTQADTVSKRDYWEGRS